MRESGILRVNGLENKVEYQKLHCIESYQGYQKNPLRSLYNYDRDFPCPLL